MDKSVEKVDNSLSSRRVLGIFAKEPVPGQVKTRLSPPLTSEQAAELYRISLLETVAEMSEGDFDLVICYSGGEDFFLRNFHGVTLRRQQGDDLGARMANAMQSFFLRNYQQAVLIGSDSPDLPQALVTQAFSALEDRSLVLAPAHDGGYVLIGEACHHPQLFEDMPWSTSGLLAATRRRAAATGVGYHVLTAWDDLDDVAALQRFMLRSPASRTAAYLRHLAACEGVSAQR